MYSDEEQKEIEAVFLRSWDDFENSIFKFRNYTENSFGSDLLTLVSLFRLKGYDRALRVGSAMDWFSVSRSREHGLRPNQPRLGLLPMESHKMHVNFVAINTHVRFTSDCIAITPEIENLLIALLVYPID